MKVSVYRRITLIFETAIMFLVFAIIFLHQAPLCHRRHLQLIFKDCNHIWENVICSRNNSFSFRYNMVTSQAPPCHRWHLQLNFKHCILIWKLSTLISGEAGLLYLVVSRQTDLYAMKLHSRPKATDLLLM